VDLRENPDVAAESRDVAPPGALRIGFALESHDLVAHARAKLAAIPEAWASQDREATEARVRVALTDLEGALEALAGLETEHRRLHDMANALVTYQLNGEGSGPHLAPPNPGIPLPILAELRRAVRNAASNLTP
jgi:hypothetical protein